MIFYTFLKMENSSFKVALLRILYVYLQFFLEINDVFMISAFITSFDKKTSHCVQLMLPVGGNEFIHTFFQVPEWY